MGASQPIENQQRSYEGFEKKHDMECTTPAAARKGEPASRAHSGDGHMGALQGARPDALLTRHRHGWLTHPRSARETAPETCNATQKSPPWSNRANSVLASVRHAATVVDRQSPLIS